MAPSIWGESIVDHKRRVREHILATATDLIGEYGGANVPMSVLARRAGVARATLYNYFPDFEHVLHALVGHEVDLLLARLDRELAGSRDAAQRLDRYLVTVHDWAVRQRRPAARRVRPGARRTLPPALITSMHQPLARLRDVLIGILTACIGEGSVPDDIPARSHADLILKLLLDPLPADPSTAAASREQLLSFLHRALTPQPHRP